MELQIELSLMELFQMELNKKLNEVIGLNETDYDKEDYELDLSDNEA